MNTTFTNYAEKKAKQILNLLQGYTRGIRITAILILLLMGVSNASAYYLYLYTGDFTSWGNDYAAFRVGTSGNATGDKFEWVAPNWYRCSTTKTGSQYIKRCSADGNTYWNGQFSANISSTNHVVKVTDWNTGSLYSQSPMYIAGSSWGNLASWKNNDPSGKMIYDGYQTFSITLGVDNLNSCKFKIVYYNTWENAIAYNSSNVSCVNGTVKGDGTNDNNIEFTPNNTGDVIITYNVSTGKIVITCPAPAENKFDVIAAANPTTGGTVTPTSATAMGQNSGGDITASAKTGYTFTNWTIKSGSGYFGESGTNITSTTVNTKFRPNEVSTVQANFTEIMRTITVTVDNASHGNVNKSSVTAGIATGSEEITASPKEGYEFVDWSATPGITLANSKNKTTTITKATQDGTVTANFQEKKYSITIQANNGNYGTVSPSSISVGQHTASEIITATAEPGYSFVNWTASDGITIANPTSLSTTIKATKIGTLTANFEAVPTTIYLKPSDTWKSDNARLAIYWWGDKNRNGWVDLEADCSNTTTYYSGDVPAGITNFKFVRLNPSGGHAFGDAWNQTDNLTIQSGKYLYDMTQSKKDHIFLKPNNDWKNDNAWFAAYFYNSGNSNIIWKKMTHHSDGVYGCEWPSGYTNVIFVRMKSTDTNSLTFENSWNQTKDLGYNGDDNMFIVASSAINGGDDSGKYDGSWSIYYDNCFWNNATPAYTVTFSQPTGGTIAVTKEDGSSITSGTMVELNSEINVTISAKDGYEYSTTSKITIGKNTKTLIEGASTHTICGTTNISAKFSEKLYTVTIRTSDANQGTVSPETLQVGKITSKSIKATSKTGSIFSHWEASDGITITNANSAQTTVKATCAGTITAYFSPGRTIYLKPDHSNWEDGPYQAHVWTEGLARIAIDMVQDGNFYKCEVPGAYTKIQFQKKNTDVKTEEMDIMATCNFFDVDDTDQAKGVWMEYNAWHIAGTFTDWKLCGYQMEEKNGVYTYIRHFKAGDYDFKIVQNGTWYGNNGDMTREYCVDWIMSSSESSDCTLKADVDGDYVFTFNPNTKKLTVTYPELPYYLFGSFNDWTPKDAKYQFINGRREVWLDQGTTYDIKVIDFQGQAYGKDPSPTLSSNSSSVTLQEYNMGGDVKFTPPVTGSYTFTFDVKTKTLSVILPETPKDGDYRLAYIEGTNTSSFHPGHHIKKSAIEKIDTVSFFIAHDDKTPKILVQQYNGTTWSTQATKAISVDASGVYNFHLKQTNGGNTATLLETIVPYTGKYYIRTNCADGGWNDFKIAANLMTYSSYADNNEIFDHYFCKWVGNDYTRLAFTIANDYSYCVSDTLHGDGYTNDDSSSQKAANVRFAWDSKENKLSRAYIDGTGENGSEFLQLRDASNLKDANGNVLNSITFNDLQNWIYQVDVKANKDTEIKLVAKYNNVQQYFKGTENSTAKLLQSTSNDFYNIRVIYDFKTNHLIAAWLAAGEIIDNTETLGADMMVIRRDQKPADQLHFNPNKTTLADVKTAYAVTTFSKDFITDETKTQYERALYWVSFPFAVRISDVFGFGEYGDQWIMQYYDGDARARYGLFSNSGTYWKYITETETILEAGKGYVLTLDLDKVKNSFLHDAQDVSLYFPSKDPLGAIDGTLPTNVPIPEHTCNIQYGELDHTITDSHWNMIGVPRFADISDFNTTPGYVNTEDLSFYYEYLARTNTYQVTANTTNFQAMYGYMVQFAGTLNWSEKTVSPAQLAARRNSESDEPEKISFRLEIAQGEEMADQTFVQLQQEGATAEFDMNLDLTKIINSGANIYTLAGEQRIQSAGNALPMGEAVVPVGVKIATEGEYTLRMPDGTEGMVVELIDYETNTRTNLLLSDYIVTLPKGTHEKRFALHIQPQKDVVTGVENIGENGKVKTENGKPNKFLIDGKLVIRTAEGAVYDAQGKRM